MDTVRPELPAKRIPALVRVHEKLVPKRGGFVKGEMR